MTDVFTPVLMLVVLESGRNIPPTDSHVQGWVADEHRANIHGEALVSSALPTPHKSLTLRIAQCPF